MVALLKTTITKMAAKDGDQVSTTRSCKETLSDMLQKIMLGPLKENQDPVEDKAIEFSLLVAQLKSSKSGKAEVLQETAAMVKAFLKQNTKENVGLLLGTKEFMPFLGKSLKIKSELTNSKLLINVLVIIQTILQKHGHGKNLELTKKLRTTDLIPQLMQFFNFQDPGVLENVALTFNTIAYHPKIRHVLMSEPNCSTLIKALTKILNSSNPSKRLVQFIGSILEGLSLGGTTTLEEGKENANLRASLPPLPIIKSILPLISRLCDIGNAQVIRIAAFLLNAEVVTVE